MKPEEREFWEKHLREVKVVPENEVAEGTAAHLCTLEPQPGCPNYVSNCCVCNSVVYFSNNKIPHIDKICSACAIKQPIEKSITTPTDLRIFADAIFNEQRRN